MFVNNPTGYIGKSNFVPQKGVSRQGTDCGFLGKAEAVRKFLGRDKQVGASDSITHSRASNF
jgi:hypothetical protein